MVSWTIRLEGFAIALVAVYFYIFVGGNWLLFVILLLAPDISLLGYFKDRGTGALTYNLMHNLILPFILILSGIEIPNSFILSLGLILLVHVGMDRFLGFGLKYPSNFKDTHLQKL